MTHPLLAIMDAAASGRFPPVDGAVEVLPEAGRNEAVVAFTGHAYVATAVSEGEVRHRGLDGYGSALAPDFLRWLAGPEGWIDSIDAVLVTTGLGGGSLPLRADLEAHPRVGFARQVRDDVVVHGDERGLVTIGRGLAGRTEISIEVPADQRGQGQGRSLLAAARALVPPGSWLYAAVAPGNAASLRSFLAAGFVPIASQVLIQPRR